MHFAYPLSPVMEGSSTLCSVVWAGDPLLCPRPATVSVVVNDASPLGSCCTTGKGLALPQDSDIPPTALLMGFHGGAL